MEALERHRGHFYNWYDTQSLQPLQPAYISTVDSGNLAGHLLTLRQGLLALPDDRILGSRVFEGISDTIRVLEDMDGKTASDQLVQLQKLLKSAIDSPPTTPQKWLPVSMFLMRTPRARRSGGRMPLPGNAGPPSMI
jgi:hypothetical protein